MHSILLVDDDMIVRTYLTEIVKWEEHGFKVVGTARDGEEALELSRSLQPDVVITDISMPRMDGVELIHCLRTEGYDGVIDVMSCHDDFDLVKNAIQGGADDYLLKNHLNEREVREMVKKISSQIEKRQRRSKQFDELQTLASRGMKEMRRELLIGILRGTVDEENMGDMLRNAGLHCSYRRLMTVLIRPIRADQEQVDTLLNLCDQRFQQERADIMYLHRDILCMLIDLTEEPSMKKASDLSERLQTLVQRMSEQYLNLEVAMAASGVCDGKNAIADSLRQANGVILNSFYGAGRWRYGVDRAMADELPEEAKIFTAKLPDLMRDADDRELRNEYEAALMAIKQVRVNQGVVISWMHECDAAVNYRRPEAQYTSMRQWDDYFCCIDEYIAERGRKKRNKIPENASPAIRRAVQYIYAHFDEPISLSLVAQHIHLSSTYFSTLFKSEMGVGFSEFLTALRMEWVCERMKSTSLTIRQISMEAGFPDYPYFCKTFKKLHGTSPAAYRKEHSIE